MHAVSLYIAFRYLIVFLRIAINKGRRERSNNPALTWYHFPSNTIFLQNDQKSGKILSSPLELRT